MEDTAMLQTPTKPTKSQVSNPVVRLGETNAAFGGVEGAVFGGVSHGKFENDFDWKQLATLGGPQCGEVCRDPDSANQCFPVKWNDHYGPPCGIVDPSNGCFQNEPTQTCALCTFPAQPYCCPYEQIPICGEYQGVGGSPEPVRVGLPQPVYGGIQGGVFGGFQHGNYDNDFNWKQLSTWTLPRCDQVCRSPVYDNQCYPVKWSGYFGPPCGIVNPSNGCFQNQPTQTCALCTYPAQPYCCPYHLIPICDEWVLDNMHASAH